VLLVLLVLLVELVLLVLLVELVLLVLLVELVLLLVLVLVLDELLELVPAPPGPDTQAPSGRPWQGSLPPVAQAPAINAGTTSQTHVVCWSFMAATLPRAGGREEDAPRRYSGTTASAGCTISSRWQGRAGFTARSVASISTTRLRSWRRRRRKASMSWPTQAATGTKSTTCSGCQSPR
jgi:hypothetical protein